MFEIIATGIAYRGFVVERSRGGKDIIETFTAHRSGCLILGALLMTTWPDEPMSGWQARGVHFGPCAVPRFEVA